MNDDLISRSALKEAINTYDKFACLPNGKLEPIRNLEHPEMFEEYVHFRDIIKCIDNAPTVDITEQITIKCDTEEDKQKLLSAFRNAKLKALVEEKRPQGEWIKTGYVDEYVGDEYQCSICGAKDHWHNYCPTCGAHMGVKTC